MIVPWLVAILFAIFIFLDVCSIFPRIAGTLLNKANTGFSFQIIVNTLKRVFVVLYPPILGVIVLRSNMSGLFGTIALSYALGLLALGAAVLLRAPTIKLFEAAILSYGQHPNMLRAFISGIRGVALPANSDLLTQATRLRGPIDWAIAFSGSVIFTAYFGATFTVNVVSERFPLYAPIILQLGGLINAVGTLVLAFVYDPRLSRRLDNDNDHGVIVRSVIVAYLMCLLVMSPIYYAVLYLFLM